MFLSGKEGLSPIKEVDLSKFFVLVPWGFRFVPGSSYINKKKISQSLSETEKPTEPPEADFYFYLRFLPPKGNVRELAEEIWESTWLSCPEIIPLGREARKPLLEALNHYLKELFAKKVRAAYLFTYSVTGEQEEELIRLYKKQNLGELLKIDGKNARIVPEEGYEKEATIALTRFSAEAILWALEEGAEGKKGGGLFAKSAKVGFEIGEAEGAGSIKVDTVLLNPFGERIENVVYEVSITSQKSQDMVISMRGKNLVIKATNLLAPKVKEWLQLIAERAEDFAPSLSLSPKDGKKHEIVLEFKRPEKFPAVFLAPPYYPITITEQVRCNGREGLRIRLEREANGLLLQKGVKYESRQLLGTQEGKIAEWAKKLWGARLGFNDPDGYDTIAVVPKQRDRTAAKDLVLQIESAMGRPGKDNAFGELLMAYLLHNISKVKEEVKKARNLSQKLCLRKKTIMPIEGIISDLPKGLNPEDRLGSLLQLARKVFLSPSKPEDPQENLNDFPETYILAFLGLKDFIESQGGNGARVSMEPVRELEKEAGLPGRLSALLEGENGSRLMKDLARLLIITYNLTRYAIQQHPTSEYREPTGISLQLDIRGTNGSLNYRRLNVVYSNLAKIGEGEDAEEMWLNERIELRVE